MEFKRGDLVIRINEDWQGFKVGNLYEVKDPMESTTLVMQVYVEASKGAFFKGKKENFITISQYLVNGWKDL